jgi:hypothetical protein
MAGHRSKSAVKNSCAAQDITPGGADLDGLWPDNPDPRMSMFYTFTFPSSNPAARLIADRARPSTKYSDDDASGRFPLRGVPTVPVAARGAGKNQNMYGVVLRAGRLATDKRHFGYTRYLAPQPAWLQSGAGTCGTRTMEQPHVGLS